MSVFATCIIRPFSWPLLFLVLFQGGVVVNSFQLVHHIHHNNGRLLTRIYTEETSATTASSPASILQNSKNEAVPIFYEIAHQAGLCLLESDLCRDAVNKPANQTEFVAKGATNWIDDASSLRLHNIVNRVQLNLLQASTGNMDRDDALSWMRWMKSIPCPAILDLTSEFQRAVNQTALFSNPKGARILELLEHDPFEFLQRFACRVILLPSGTTLSSPLVETSSSLIHGKLLYGGVTRSRLLQRQGQQQQQQSQQHQRLVGERQAIKTNVKDAAAGASAMMGASATMGALAMLGSSSATGLGPPRRKATRGTAAAAGGVGASVAITAAAVAHLASAKKLGTRNSDR